MKYERFVNDFEYVFDRVEKFINRPIPEDRKQRIIHDFSLNEVEKKSKALGTFNKCDQKDQIHGNHVSLYRGTSGYYKRFLNPEDINHVYSHFSVLFETFGYERPGHDF